MLMHMCMNHMRMCMYVPVYVCKYLYTAVDSKEQNWTLVPPHSRLFSFSCYSRIFTIKHLPYGKKLVKLKLPSLSNNQVRSKCKLGDLW